MLVEIRLARLSGIEAGRYERDEADRCPSTPAIEREDQPLTSSAVVYVL